MLQPLLHHQEQALGIAGLGIEDAVGVEAHAGEARREEVAALHHPQHGMLEPRQDPAYEERRRGAMREVVACAHHLMQRPEGEAATRKMAINRAHAEGQDGPFAQLAAVEGTDALAQIVDEPVGG
jgi:hypothetical protein